MNRQVGLTIQSPENVREYRERLANAKQLDGLSATKNPDMLVQGPAGWRAWDTATMLGETATAESALRTIGDKVSKGQSVRIAINLDTVKNDGISFARELRNAIRADQRNPLAQQIAGGVKEVVVIKGGVVYRAYP
jgi:hypothetical protein